MGKSSYYLNHSTNKSKVEGVVTLNMQFDKIPGLLEQGSGVYRDLDFWNSVVEWTNIDRDVVICIWVAESTLWKYLTTSNNIWNVGNNDRWDRIAYDTPYHTINQLSRYGNAEWKIYASSPINRQTNVMKCLSKIKWYTVPEDFPFRTWPNPNISEIESTEQN